eukprot:2340064-Rhodomonas_salina.1
MDSTASTGAQLLRAPVPLTVIRTLAPSTFAKLLHKTPQIHATALQRRWNIASYGAKLNSTLRHKLSRCTFSQFLGQGPPCPYGTGDVGVLYQNSSHAHQSSGGNLYGEVHAVCTDNVRPVQGVKPPTFFAPFWRTCAGKWRHTVEQTLPPRPGAVVTVQSAQEIVVLVVGIPSVVPTLPNLATKSSMELYFRWKSEEHNDMVTVRCKSAKEKTQQAPLPPASQGPGFY